MATAVLPRLNAGAYRRHALHASERLWVEKNCYVDIWIELLHALGLEPLAAMGAKESALIMELVKDLSSQGVSMIVIDHNYAHLFALCDRLNVIQQGRITVDTRVADTSVEELTELMVRSFQRQLLAGQEALGEIAV